MYISTPIRLLCLSTVFLLITACRENTPGQSSASGLDPEQRQLNVSREVLEVLGGDMPSAEQLSAVVATVNGSPIVARRVFELSPMNLTRSHANGAAIDERQVLELRRIVLQIVIASELLVQEAEKEGLTVATGKIDDEIVKMRSLFGGQEIFTLYLETVGLDEAALRAESERRLLAEVYRERLGNEVDITEEMLRKYYNENPSIVSEGEEVHAAFIFVKTLRNDPEEKLAEARSRIEQAEEAIDGGMSFEEAARTYSQAENAAGGGDLGFLARGDMVPTFEQQVFALKPGETSEIFQTDFGLNLVQCIERKEPERRTFDQVKPELMLDVAKRQREARVGTKIAELIAAADIRLVEGEWLNGKPVADAAPEPES